MKDIANPIEYLAKIIDRIESLDSNGIVEIKEFENRFCAFTTKMGDYAINVNVDEIWFSSPISGPNKFSFYKKTWCNKSKNNAFTLNEILKSELQDINFDL